MSFLCQNRQARPLNRREMLRTSSAGFGALALQVLVVTVGVLGRVFDTVPLDASEWALVVAGGLVGPALIAGVARSRR